MSVANPKPVGAMMAGFAIGAVWAATSTALFVFFAPLVIAVKSPLPVLPLTTYIVLFGVLGAYIASKLGGNTADIRDFLGKITLVDWIVLGLCLTACVAACELSALWDTPVSYRATRLLDWLIIPPVIFLLVRINSIASRR
jgi:hypothetical protein